MNFNFGPVSSLPPQQPQQQVPVTPMLELLEAHRRSYAPYKSVPSSAAEREVYLPNRGSAGPQMQLQHNEECRFKGDFYDLKQGGGDSGSSAQQAHSRTRYNDDRNPDPDNLVPVKLYGADDLSRRFDEKTKQSNKIKEEMARCLRIIQVLSKKETDLRTLFEARQKRQVDLENRMLKLLGEVEKCRFQNRPMELEELKFREKAELMVNEMRHRHAQLTGLINRQAQHDLVKDEYADNLSDAELDVIYSAMSKQHEGLQKVAEILDRDLRHVQIIQTKLEQRDQEHSGYR